MIDLALNHQEEIKKKFRDTWFSEKHKYYSISNYYAEFQIDENTWDYHQFVSLDSNGNIIGYIGYRIDRTADMVDNLSIINFNEDNKVIFGTDINTIVRDIFEKFHFRKLNFKVVVGNPIEVSYDRLIKKYNGKVVGIQEKHVRLYDGQYYDMRLYEILIENYMNVVNKLI